MDIQEFSTEFDVLYNNIASNGAPGVNEYEKSVFLTKALNEIIKAYFLKNTNKSQAGFDENALLLTNFSNLIVTETVNTLLDPKYSTIKNSKSIKLPDSILFILNELLLVVDKNNNEYALTIIPINSDAYSRIMSKPFNRPYKRQAWRLDVNTIEDDSVIQYADLIPNVGQTIKSYKVRYVKRPTPIILENLEEVYIDGENEAMTCKLNPVLHRDILLRAVELAKASYAGDLASMVQLGLNSQTNIGQTLNRLQS